MAAHSKIGASGMKRWAACAGSVRLSDGIDSRSSVFAEEGTFAHKLAADLIECAEVDYLADCPPEMVQHVERYAEIVAREAADPDDVLLVEQRFHMADLHQDLFGTSDAVIWQPSLKQLVVIDLKYGAGVAVEVRDNPQLLYYALGALLENDDWRPETVKIVIVQPRCPHSDGPVRSVTYPVADLFDFYSYLMRAVGRVEAAYADQSNTWTERHLKAGDHCRWCPAAAICPLLKSTAQAEARKAFVKVGDRRQTYDPAELAATLDWLPIFEAWIKNVREFAYQEAEAGKPIPGFKLVDKIATRKWLLNIEEPLAKKLGVTVGEVFKPREMLGITEIEKLAPGKNADERAAFLAEFVSKISSGHTLAHESDKRPAIRVDARTAFAAADNAASSHS